MRKLIDKCTRNDLKIGQVLMTNKGTGFIVGFPETTSSFYFYIINSMTAKDTNDGMIDLPNFESVTCNYLSQLANNALTKSMNETLLLRLNTTEHKRYVNVRLNENDIITWRTKSALLNKSKTIFRNTLDFNVKPKSGNIYYIRTKLLETCKCVYLGKSKFLRLDLLEQYKKNNKLDELRIKINYSYSNSTINKKYVTFIEETDEKYDIKELGELSSLIPTGKSVGLRNNPK